MSEQMELLKDYLECIDKINNLFKYSGVELMCWEIRMSVKWASKGPEYALCFGERFLSSFENQSIYTRIVNLERNLRNVASMKAFGLDKIIWKCYGI